MRQRLIPVFLVCVVSLAARCSPVAAEEPAATVRRSPVFLEPLKAGGPLQNAGLFIGVNEFTKDEGISSLQFAVNDAVETAYVFVFELKLIPARQCFLCLGGQPSGDVQKQHLEALKQAEAHVTETADRASIYQTLDQLKELSFDPKRSLVVVSLSTHGIFDRGVPYVIPSDGLRSRLDRTALPLTDVEEDVAATKAGHRLLLVDACQERVAARSLNGQGGVAMSSEFFKSLEKPTGQAKLASCSPGEFSFEISALRQGVFTHALLSALRGQAHPGADNLVRLDAVISATKTGVAEWAKANRKQQTIFFAGPEESRTLPLAAGADDLATLGNLLRKKVSAKANGFTQSLLDQLLVRLPNLRPDDEDDRQFLEVTRKFARGVSSEFEYLPVLKETLARAVTSASTPEQRPMGATTPPKPMPTGPVKTSPKLDDPVATLEEVYDVLSRLRDYSEKLQGTKNKMVPIRVALVLYDEPTRSNILDLDRLVNQEGVVVNDVILLGKRHRLEEMVRDFWDAEHIFIGDVDAALDRKSTDAVYILGFLNATEFKEPIIARETSSHGVVSEIAVIAIEAGKDVFVSDDRIRWQPAVIDHRGAKTNPLDVCTKNARICWSASLPEANDFAAFCKSVRTRAPGQGSILK